VGLKEPPVHAGHSLGSPHSTPAAAAPSAPYLLLYLLRAPPEPSGQLGEDFRVLSVPRPWEISVSVGCRAWGGYGSRGQSIGVSKSLSLVTLHPSSTPKMQALGILPMVEI
jgi:hypothetical protein